MTSERKTKYVKVDKEGKDEALRSLDRGESVAEVSERLGVHQNTVRAWLAARRAREGYSVQTRRRKPS